MKTKLTSVFSILSVLIFISTSLQLTAQVETIPLKNAHSISCFDDGTYYAYVNDSGSDCPLDLTTQGSVEAWVKVATFADYAGIALKPNGTTDSYTLQFGGEKWSGYGKNDQILFGINDGADKNIISDLHLVTGKWYHVVGAWSSEGDSLVLYINGKKDHTSDQTLDNTTANNSPVLIGTGNYGHFDGEINHVRIWNKVLTLEEVQRVMYETEISTTHDLYNNLVGAWKFNEGTGTSVPDGSKNSNCATLINSSMWNDDGAPLGAIWQGENHNWNDVTNWLEGLVPNENIKVIVPAAAANSVEISTFEAARDLTVEDGSNLTIKSTSTGTGSLFVKEKSDGDIFVERYIPANYYHYISKPVNDTRTIAAIETINDETYMGLSTSVDYNSLFAWDETDGSGTGGDGAWVDMLRDYNTSALITGRGYAYADRANGGNPGGGTNNTIRFQGEIETGDVTVNCSYTADAGTGFHVLGNPFSSTIAITDDASINNFLSDNSAILDDHFEAIFLWQENNDETQWRDNYRVICNAGFSGSSPELNFDFIQLGQAFMVKVVSPGGDVVFNSNTQVDPDENSTPFFKKEETSWPGVELTVKNEFAESQTLIGFNGRMTTGLDPSYDVESLKSNGAINLYSHLDAENSGDFAVQSLPLNQESVTCGVDVIEAGDYTFSAFQEGLTELYIEDTERHTITDLLAGDSPSIFLSEGSYNSRFILHFKTANNATNSIETSEIDQIYSYSNSIYFRNITGTAQIFDISGRLIKQVEINAPLQTVPMDELHGIFLVKTNSGNRKVVL